MFVIVKKYFSEVLEVCGPHASLQAAGLAASKFPAARNWSYEVFEVQGEPAALIHEEGRQCSAPGCPCADAHRLATRGYFVSWCSAGHVVMSDEEGRRTVVGSFADEEWTS